MHWPRFLAALLCALVGPSFDVSAEPGRERWVVLPVGVGNADGLSEATESVRRALLARGLPALTGERAGERFEVVGSAPAPDVTPSDIERWVASSNAAVRHLARADYKAARRELRAAQRLADEAAEELNREAARAQQVLDTCLFMVRAYLETGEDAEARRQARECRQLVPYVEPTAYRHTPEVRDLLGEVDRALAAEALGVLVVSSKPAGCLVRVNGVEVGQTPASVVDLPPGTYRVQVECAEGERGRIHRIQVTSGESARSFDHAFDRAVRTRPELALQYQRSAATDARMEHASMVVDALGAEGVVVVSEEAPEVARLDLRADGYAPASAWVPVGEAGVVDPEDARRAVEALLAGRSVDYTGAHPIARASWAAASEPEVAAMNAALMGSAEASADSRRPREQRVAGWTLFGAGMASIGASVGLHVWRGNLGDALVAMPASLENAQQWKDVRVAVWTTAAFGGAATTAAMPLLLPNRPQTPWWGWALGTAGLGLTGYAIYEGVTMTACPEPFVANEAAARACVARGQEAGRVALALAGAAPLLTVPLVYLFRPLRMEPSVSASRSGALVRVRKAF